MPYIIVTGSFQISQETWTFTQWLYTRVHLLSELDRDDIQERVSRHINLYWGDATDEVASDAFDFNIRSIDLDLESPRDLNRVEAFTEYGVSSSYPRAQHTEGYVVEVLTNLQERNWEGTYGSASKKFPSWLSRQ